MNTLVRQLTSSSITSTADDIAHLDVPRSGFIIAVVWACRFDFGADNDAIDLELSFASASQITTNDPNSVIDGVSMGYGITGAAGSDLQGINRVLSGIMIPVRTNDRLYLHCIESGSVTGRVRCLIHIGGAK